uniref:Transposase (Putative), gypsy type n=1 Tax=Tanacetum cinerariifolium TaxID=118510 RepID=A0A6L2LF96_TANCI|nr:hypothetical protein [Tanacetum cinerariifolium]
MSVITDIRCVLTQKALDALCDKFHILEEKFSEAFLCLVGLSRPYTFDEETYPRFLHKNEDEIDIFAFIHTPNPTKVRVIKRERNEDEPRLLDTIVGRTVPLLPVAPDRANSELEASVERLFDEGGSGVSHPPKKLKEDYETPNEAFVGASVSIGASQRFVISSDSSYHSGPTIAEAKIDSLVRSSAPIMTTATTVTSMVDSALVAKEKPVKPSLFSVDSSSADSSLAVGADPNIGVFSDLTGNDFLVGGIHTVIDLDTDLQKVYFFAYVRGMEHDQLFTEFNVRATHQMSLSAEVKMHAEYNVKERRRLNSVVEKQDKLLKARDGEFKKLKAKLLLKETEAAEATRLRAQTFNLEAVEKSLRDEVNALKGRNVILKKERNALDVKVIDLEASIVGTELYDDCMEQLEKLQDNRIKFFNDKLAKLDSDTAEMTCHLKEKIYPHLLNTISSRRWLLTHGLKIFLIKWPNSFEYLTALGTDISRAIEKGMQSGLASGIDHGREGRSLADDASTEDIMNVFRLDDALADAPGKNNLQPDIEQLKVPIYRSKDQVLIGKTSLSFALSVSHSRVERIRENIAAQRFAHVGVWIPLSKPLSVTSLMGKASTFDVVPAASMTTTAISTTFASATSIPPISTDDYDVDGQEGAGTDGRAVVDGNVSPFPNVDDVELNIPQ